MSTFFDWIFGKAKAPESQPIVTVGVSSDEWLEWMLDEKDRRKERLAHGGGEV